MGIKHNDTIPSSLWTPNIMKLLHVDSSITGANSVSRELSQFVVDQLRQQNDQVQVEHVDLALNPPPHFSADSLGMRLGLDPATLSERQRAENAITEQYLNQFLASDVVVIGAPFYNFTIPSQLKAWMDRLAQAGRQIDATPAANVVWTGGRDLLRAVVLAGTHIGGAVDEHGFHQSC